MGIKKARPIEPKTNTIGISGKIPFLNKTFAKMNSLISSISSGNNRQTKKTDSFENSDLRGFNGSTVAKSLSYKANKNIAF